MPCLKKTTQFHTCWPPHRSTKHKLEKATGKRRDGLTWQHWERHHWSGNSVCEGYTACSCCHIQLPGECEASLPAEEGGWQCFPAHPSLWCLGIAPFHILFHSLHFPAQSARAVERMDWPNKLFWSLLMWYKESCKNQYKLVPTWRRVIVSNRVIWLMFYVLSLGFSDAPCWAFLTVHYIRRKLSDKEYAVNCSCQGNQNEIQRLLVE